MFIRRKPVHFLETITLFLSANNRPNLLPSSYSQCTYVGMIRYNLLLSLSCPFGKTYCHGLPTHSCDVPAVMSLAVISTLSSAFYVQVFVVIFVEQKIRFARKKSCCLSFSIQLCQLLTLYLGHPPLAVVGGTPWGHSLNVP